MTKRMPDWARQKRHGPLSGLTPEIAMRLRLNYERIPAMQLADLMGLSHTTVYKWMRKLGLPAPGRHAAMHYTCPAIRMRREDIRSERMMELARKCA